MLPNCTLINGKNGAFYVMYILLHTKKNTQFAMTHFQNDLDLEIPPLWNGTWLGAAELWDPDLMPLRGVIFLYFSIYNNRKCY